MVTTCETKITLISKMREVNIDIFKGPQYSSVIQPKLKCVHNL